MYLQTQIFPTMTDYNQEIKDLTVTRSLRLLRDGFKSDFATFAYADERMTALLHDLASEFVDNNIPLAHCSSDMKDFDGWYLAPLLEKSQVRGGEVELVLGDNHYSTTDNYASVHVNFEAKAHFNLAVSDVIHPEATKEKLDELYDDLCDRSYYVKDADENYKHSILIGHGYKKIVGQYYRNGLIREFEECPDSAEDLYHQRSKVEGYHGHIKEGLVLESAMNRRGIENTHRHASLCLIALLSVAMTRLKAGYVEELNHLEGLV